MVLFRENYGFFLKGFLSFIHTYMQDSRTTGVLLGINFLGSCAMPGISTLWRRLALLSALPTWNLSDRL